MGAAGLLIGSISHVMGLISSSQAIRSQDTRIKPFDHMHGKRLGMVRHRSEMLGAVACPVLCLV